MSRFIESPRYFEEARERGVELRRRTPSPVVITGIAQLTPFGGTEETFQALLDGRSAVGRMDLANHQVSMAAPLPAELDLGKHLVGKERGTRLSRLSKIAIYLSREAAKRAGLAVNDDGTITTGVHHNRRAVWVGSGIGETHQLINVAEKLGEKGSASIRPFEAMAVFPEEIAGNVAIALDFGGWGGSTVAACATGADNFIEAARLMAEGRVDLAVAGGLEDALYNHPEVTAAIFTGVGALSQRNDDPERASRPFDSQRDGFVMASGGAVVTMERLDDALKRGAPILAVVSGFAKKMDGNNPTELEPSSVADTIAQALFDQASGGLRKPDIIFAHATSTQIGDPGEIEALRRVFGSDLRDVPITALKSFFGHLFAGAGSANIVNAVLALQRDVVPFIRNLSEPDPAILKGEELPFIQNRPYRGNVDSVLALAYGFGGYNAVVFLEKYQGQKAA